MPAARRRPPIGRALWDAVQVLHREFDAVLAREGGSRPVWFILLALGSGPASSQREIAERVGVQGATLTHHLHAMEEAGLVRRFRPPEDRRVQQIELTPAGRALSQRLGRAASAFDAKIRAGIPEAEIEQMRRTLGRLVTNASDRPGYPD